MGTINEIYAGLSIFIRNGQRDNYIAAKHDIIYGPCKDDMLLSLVELEILEAEGWRIEDDLWVHSC